MLELYQSVTAVLAAANSGAGWMILTPVVIKCLVTFLNSGLTPARLLVELWMKAYNRLPTPDLDYPHAMRALVWGLAGISAVAAYLTGHTVTEAFTAFGSGGFGALGLHETADSLLALVNRTPPPVGTGGQSGIHGPQA